MSDMHVLAGDGQGNYRIANHYPIPDANNDVGTNYRTALINSGLGGMTTMDEGSGPGQIESAELAQLQAGAVFEEVYDFPADSGGGGSAYLQTQLREQYTLRKAAKLAELEARLRYFGHTESESL